MCDELAVEEVHVRRAHTARAHGFVFSPGFQARMAEVAHNHARLVFGVAQISPVKRSKQSVLQAIFTDCFYRFVFSEAVPLVIQM